MILQRRQSIVGSVLALASAVALTAATLSGVPTAQAESKAAEPGAYTVFNKPHVEEKDGKKVGVSDYGIQDDLVGLIEDTPKGETIYGSMFSWTQAPVAEALRDAQKRGVHVKLAIDAKGGTVNADPDNKAQQILKAADLDQLVYCQGSENEGTEDEVTWTSCVGNRGGINHNKLFTFSKTGDKVGAVWVASYNITGAQGYWWNNAVVNWGRPDLYDEFEGHMKHMLAQDRDNDYYNSDVGTYHSSDDQVSVYMSPRADSDGGTDTDAATDTVAQILSKMKTAEDGCRLDLTQAQMTGPRLPVTDEVIRIAKLGCQVRIAYGDGLSQYTMDHLQGVPNLKMRGFHDASDANDAHKITIHSKIIRMHGNIDGKHQDIVLTGSHNITRPALRLNDEILLETKQADVISDFDKNFDDVWAAAACVNVPDEIVCQHDD